MGNLPSGSVEEQGLLRAKESFSREQSVVIKEINLKRPKAKFENNYGSMTISLDKAFYRPGDAIKGKITLKMKAACPAKNLSLKIKGRETCVWQEMDIDKKITRAGDRAIFQHKLEIASWTDYMIPEGNHVYRFKIYLKDKSLPGSTTFQNEDCKAKISYKLRADLQGPTKEERMKKSIEVFIREKYKAVHLLQREMEFDNMTCNCLPQGKTTFLCFFDKAFYHLGESVQITLEIDNRKNNIDYDYLEVKLIRLLTMEDNKQNKKAIETVISKRRLPGIKAWECLIGDKKKLIDLSLTPADLKEALIPTINGKRISCSYNVRLSGFVDSWLGELQQHSFELPLIIHDCKTEEAESIRKDVTPLREKFKGGSTYSNYSELDVNKNATPLKGLAIGKIEGSIIEKDDTPITPVRKLPRKKANE